MFKGNNPKKCLFISFSLVILLLLFGTMVTAQETQIGEPITENESAQNQQGNLDGRCTQCHSEIATAYAEGPHSDIRCVRCHNQAAQHVDAPSKVPPGIDVSADNCGECHKLQYDSYRATKKVDQTPQKQDEFPLLPKLLSGHAFAKDYREPREHFHMLTDIEATTRKKGATCYTCKSADVYYQWGDTITFDSNVEDLLKSGTIRHAITCVNCHSPHNGEERIVQQALKEAIDKAPENHPAKDDKIGNQMCAQCHVEYNFNVPDKKNEFPFRKVNQIEQYSKDTKIWRDHPTGGWEHPELGFMLYKVQHPETELYWESTHDKAGVTCIECHMPKVKTAEGETYTQHWITSPKNHPDETCEQCHPGKNHNERIEKIQKDLYALMKETMDNMSVAIDKIQATGKGQTKNDTLYNQAKDKYFTAHLNWEWIAAENSMGFHNPSETRKALTLANDSAKEAATLATRATTELEAAEEQKEAVQGVFSGSTGIALGVAILAGIGGLIYYLMRRNRA